MGNPVIIISHQPHTDIDHLTDMGWCRSEGARRRLCADIYTFNKRCCLLLKSKYKRFLKFVGLIFEQSCVGLIKTTDKFTS